MSRRSSVTLPYGRQGLKFDLSSFSIPFHFIEHERRTDHPIDYDSLDKSFKNPIGTASLREIIHPDDSVCIVTSDGTRPFPPMRFMVQGILRHLGFAPREVTILAGSGSHAPHTERELAALFGANLHSCINIVSHDSRDRDANLMVGTFSDGPPIMMNRRYVEADKRIVVGHIEPHFFAGFTGGAKGIAPAICGIETIHQLHSFRVIDDPTSTFGDIEQSASMDLMREATAAVPPDFLVNLILDEEQQPVAVYSGDYIEAHRQGVAQARNWCEAEVSRRYPIVITSNSGYPLDQNLYQTVKGINVAHTIVEPGGTIIIVAECGKGIPNGSQFDKVISSDESVATILSRLANDKGCIDDRWQAQRLCRILADFRVILVSSLSQEVVKRCKLDFAPTVEEALREALAQHSAGVDVGILTYGPLTLPRVV